MYRLSLSNRSSSTGAARARDRTSGDVRLALPTLGARGARRVRESALGAGRDPAVPFSSGAGAGVLRFRSRSRYRHHNITSVFRVRGPESGTLSTVYTLSPHSPPLSVPGAAAHRTEKNAVARGDGR